MLKTHRTLTATAALLAGLALAGCSSPSGDAAPATEQAAASSTFEAAGGQMEVDPLQQPAEAASAIEGFVTAALAEKFDKAVAVTSKDVADDKLKGALLELSLVQASDPANKVSVKVDQSMVSVEGEEASLALGGLRILVDGKTTTASEKAATLVEGAVSKDGEWKVSLR